MRGFQCVDRLQPVAEDDRLKPVLTLNLFIARSHTTISRTPFSHPARRSGRRQSVADRRNRNRRPSASSSGTKRESRFGSIRATAVRLTTTPGCSLRGAGRGKASSRTAARRSSIRFRRGRRSTSPGRTSTPAATTRRSRRRSDRCDRIRSSRKRTAVCSMRTR